MDKTQSEMRANVSNYMPPKGTRARKPTNKQTAAQATPASGVQQPLVLPRLKGQPRLEVRNLLSDEEAAALIKAAEAHGFDSQRSRGPAFGEAFRDNGRIAVQRPDFAQHLWRDTGLDQVFHEHVSGPATGLNPNIRIYRYGPDQRFGKHIDEAVRVSPFLTTRYTLLVYLNGSASVAASAAPLPAFTGGETVFYGGSAGRQVARIAPQTGMALLHRHGDSCLEHEAMAVQAGCKYVLRSDVVFSA